MNAAFDQLTKNARKLYLQQRIITDKIARRENARLSDDWTRVQG